MPVKTDLSLYAHLMRRAGFGYRVGDLEKMAERGYEQCVEDLIHPERYPDIDIDMLERNYGTGYFGWHYQWWHRMLNSQRQLEEKMTMFWHYVFATSNAKAGHVVSSEDQIEMFRKYAMTDFRTLLIELSKDPAMLYWLDNQENLKDAINENYGRELLELFSMGVGNYTEEDVKASAEAFSGWTMATPIPQDANSKLGGYATRFVYRDDQHNDGLKTFMGETGRFNGEDIVDIVARQPATARFLARRLWCWFVEDEPPVSAWNESPPLNPQAIEMLSAVYFESGGQVRPILRALFNSDAFKEARFRRVKSPVELVVGVLKLVGTFTDADPDMSEHIRPHDMGQGLMGPPTVEGWPNGMGWIDGGTLNSRVNYAVDEVSDASKPGIQKIAATLSKEGPVSPEEFVDRCIEIVGPSPISGETRLSLLSIAGRGGTLDFTNPATRKDSEARLVRMLQLIVSAREYQLC